MKVLKQILCLIAVFGFSACGNVDSTHLVFGQQQIVGLDIAASAPEQGGTLSLGYKDRNIAVIPVAVKGSDTPIDGTDGTYQRLGSTNIDAAGTEDENDAYSVIGQFELEAGTSAGPSVGLGKFFATGTAAVRLAEGFMAKLSK